MGISKYTVPTDIWYGGGEITISFPDNWQVEVFPMKGNESPILSDAQIKKRVNNPIGSLPIKEEARDANSAVILFDDMTRPTKVARIAPIVLEQLKEANVPEDSIRFILAQGAHRAHTRLDFEKKLGQVIVQRYPIFNHNPFHNCKRLGTTTFGTPVEINADVMECDYKIGIGGLIPHPELGYGGGGKIIVPGVASIETIRKMHSPSINSRAQDEPATGWGYVEHNRRLLDVEEATKMASLDFKIDALFNCNGGITHIFAGDPIAEYRAGVELAKTHYRTNQCEDKDLVIANAFCKATEAGLVIDQVLGSLSAGGGSLVIIANSPEGLAPHYLFGRWGMSRIGGFEWSEKTHLPSKVDQMIIFTQYVDKGQSWYFGPREKLKWITKWEKVLDLLGMTNKEVALYPDATLQLINKEKDIDGSKE